MELKTFSTDWGRQIRGKFKQWPRWVRAVAVLMLTVLVLTVWGIIRAGNNPVPVKVGQIIRQDVKRTVFTNGTMEAADQQTFFAPVDSTMMELNIKLGDRVTKGQILGRLDTMELGRLYQQALSNLAGKEAELAGALASNDEQQLKAAEAAYLRDKNHRDRIKTLWEAGASSAEEMEEAESVLESSLTAYQEALVRSEQGVSAKQIAALQTQVDLARQEVAQSQERLDLATLTAAFDGVATSVAAKAGNRVTAGSVLAVIAGDQSLQAEAMVNEVDGGELQAGQNVEISCLALPGRTFEGIITSIGGAAVREQGQNGAAAMKIPVSVQLKGDCSQFKLGYNVNLSITTMDMKDVLIVPIEAIIENEGQQQVWVVKDGVLELRNIETQRGNELNEIVVAGLQEGEEVVKNPSDSLLNGQKAAVIAEETEQ